MFRNITRSDPRVPRINIAVDRCHGRHDLRDRDCHILVLGDYNWVSVAKLKHWIILIPRKERCVSKFHS